jgi:GDP-fucose transporter C1
MKAPVSAAVLWACIITCCGFLVGVDFWSVFGSDPRDNGIFWGIMSSITTAIHAILIKSGMKIVKGRAIDLVYYNNLLSAILFLPVVILNGEMTVFLAQAQSQSLDQFWVAVLVTVSRK